MKKISFLVVLLINVFNIVAVDNVSFKVGDSTSYSNIISYCKEKGSYDKENNCWIADVGNYQIIFAPDQLISIIEESERTQNKPMIRLIDQKANGLGETLDNMNIYTNEFNFIGVKAISNWPWSTYLWNTNLWNVDEDVYITPEPKEMFQEIIKEVETAIKNELKK